MTNLKTPDYLNLQDKQTSLTMALNTLGFKPTKTIRHLLDTGFLVIDRNESKTVSDNFYDEQYFRHYNSYNHFKKGFETKLEVTQAGREKLYQKIPDEFKKTEKELALWMKKQEQTKQVEQELKRAEDSLAQTLQELGEPITGSKYVPSEDNTCPF